MDGSLGAGRLHVPGHKIKKKTCRPHGRVVMPCPAWSEEGSWGLLSIWWCLPCGEHSTVYRNKRNTPEVFDCSRKKSLSTLIKMELSLFKGERKAGVGGLEPDCHWGVHEEGLPGTTSPLTPKSHQLWQQSSGSLSCREKPTSYQSKGLPWASALGGTCSV